MTHSFSPDIYHIAFVTPDLDQEVDRWLASGIGPFYFSRNLAVHARHRGERHDLRLSAAFGCRGTMMVEILAQHGDTPSSFLEFLRDRPEGGLHHIAYLVDDLDRALRQAADHGEQLVQVQEFMDANGAAFEIYLEKAGARDSILTQIVVPTAWSDGFFKLRDIAADWDGTRPRRDMDELMGT